VARCQQVDCAKVALYRYTWPGQTETLACIEHAAKAQRIADHMSFALQICRIVIGVPLAVNCPYCDSGFLLRPELKDTEIKCRCGRFPLLPIDHPSQPWKGAK
jgi:hypothetical protein